MNEIQLTVSPVLPGKQVVRASIPVPPQTLEKGQSFVASDGTIQFPAAVRVLTWWPGEDEPSSFTRRAMVTFTYNFIDKQPVRFTLHPSQEISEAESRLPVSVRLDNDKVVIDYKNGPTLVAHLSAPARSLREEIRVETVEENSFFLWQRYHYADNTWPRTVEVRADALGSVIVVAHLRRDLPDDSFAPDFGWDIEIPGTDGCLVFGEEQLCIEEGKLKHPFTGGVPAKFQFSKGQYNLSHPFAPYNLKGYVNISRNGPNGIQYRYRRSVPGDKTPMQPFSWRKAEFVVVPKGAAGPTATLECPHKVEADWKLWDCLYDTGEPLDLSGQPILDSLARYHHDAITRSAVTGDDWGNITSYSDDRTSGADLGMNRLNHCSDIFSEGYRRNDKRLLEAGVKWCDNFHDQSIWWGKAKHGGTRYNNIYAFQPDKKELLPYKDTAYCWRSNDSVSFCTKGWEAFYIAYEQTGDPRMMEALKAQVDYSIEYVHAVKDYARNIGMVKDFMTLYRFTGEQRCLYKALDLFRELRELLSTGDLFTESGDPIVDDPPFIDDDKVGPRYPYAKPYIIGYALEGLPALGRIAPEEPKLRRVVEAVADFLVESQDALGGWRYPHPRSTFLILSQAVEHAWQIMQAAELLGVSDKYLDAVERVLRQRILVWNKSGRMLSGLMGWEISTARIKERSEIYNLYDRPYERDMEPDYDEGDIVLGTAPPEGIVYLFDVLRFYLKHRTVERLFAVPGKNEPLAKVLARCPKKEENMKEEYDYQRPGVKDYLPAFLKNLKNRLVFPLAWRNNQDKSFDEWHNAALAKVRECLLAAPPEAPFDPVVIAEQDRGSHMAQKIVLNITKDSRVLAYKLVPKATGSHPAVLLLHDHGARFDIGKEKVVQPWDIPDEKMASSEQWISDYYGGRYIGDVLASRGYVCFATDMLNWSDRGGAGYDGQQALASNLLHMGMSFSGVIAYEDLRAAEFLSSQPEVDGKRVAAMGLSVGAFRTWQVAALSEYIAAGAAICLMATEKGLMVPGMNQTIGTSAFTMVHPNLRNYLDYPDVASIACPKPMLFYNGLQDGLFPIPSVKEAYAVMRKVWESQNAGDRLETRLWDVPHLYSREMQEEVFAWLDRWIR